MSYRREPIEETEEDDDQIQQEEHPQPKKRRRKKEKERENKDGYKGMLRVAHNLIMYPLRKFEKAYQKRKRKPPPPPFPYSEDLRKNCFFCPVSPKSHHDSSLRPNPDAKTSSYHGSFRSLIERNDFYSPECNVHTS